MITVTGNTSVVISTLMDPRSPWRRHRRITDASSLPDLQKS
jgi:hypothetical protein